MLYSQFIYQSARAGADYGDDSVNYLNFLLRNMKQDQDYAPYLDKTYHEANAFLQRLSVLGKVPCRIKEFSPVGSNEAAVLEFSDEDGFLKPVAVFQYRDDTTKRAYDNLAFRKVGNKVYVLGSYSPYRKINVQYRIKIPVFRESDIVWIQQDTSGNYYVDGDTSAHVSVDSALESAESKQINLEDYGITDEMCLIGIDWIRGRLRDDVSKGHSEEMEAESRLNDIESDEYLYLQTKGGRVRL